MKSANRALSIVAALLLAGPAWAVDGVIEVNQAKALAGGVTAGDLAGFPVTIDAAGSYRLTSNLTTASGDAIEIKASYVTLDLNGFKVQAEIDAIHRNATETHITVENGVVVVTEYDESAISLGGQQTRLDRLRVIGGNTSLGNECVLTNSVLREGMFGGEHCLISGNTLTGPTDNSGITVGSGSRVLNNTLSGLYGMCINVTGGSCVVSGNTTDSAFYGISANDCVIVDNSVTDSGISGIRGHGSTIRGNFVSSFGTGIEASNASVVGNTVKDSLGIGLSANTSTGYKDNQFQNNNGGNANPQVSGGTQIGTNICGGNTSCP
jgi:hypothetical protein